MKYIYRNNLIDSLDAIADYDFQKIAWFENDQGLWYPFHEAVEGVFCEGFNDALKSDDIIFSKTIDEKLHELEQVCDAVGYNWYGREKELLELKEMQIIREMAKECLRLIEESDGSESTVTFLKPGEAPKV